jgi:hypothetical protein
VERMAEALSGAPPTVVSLLIDGTDVRRRSPLLAQSRARIPCPPRLGCRAMSAAR